jgi:glycosyltransferase involved in cell wall biosynthesis
MDMAPALFPDVEILHHDGYNVAYWNLANRKVSREGDGHYLVNGVPLVFAHFSGVDLSRPEIYSKHQNRFDAGGIGGLRPLYDEYLDKLRTNGHAEHRIKPYAYGSFADGTPIVPALRRTYRHNFDVCGDQPVLHPQSMERARFNEPCAQLPPDAGLPISRVMYEVRRMREDLRDAFSLSTRAGRAGYIRWYLANAAADMGLDETYVAPIRSTFAAAAVSTGGPGGLRARTGRFALRVLGWGKRHGGLAQWYARIPLAWRLALRKRVHSAAGMPMPPLPFPTAARRIGRGVRVEAPQTPGVNLLGYARGEFGIAQNVRSYARALAKVQHPFSIFNFDVGIASRQNDHSMDRYFSDTLRYADNEFFITADQMSIAHQVLGRKAFAGHYNIGFWVWELAIFPREWRAALGLVDEVWVPTAFVRDAIAAATGRPVLRMPKAIEFDVPTGMDRTYFGVPQGEFAFLFSYDFNSFASRKNPDAVIAAFRKAFPTAEQGVRLLVKSTNGARFPEQLAKLRQAVADDPRIDVRDGFLSRPEMFALQNAADCYVSLHRSEGFGLGMAESMYLGKPVIATAYSGNLDFMDRDNSLLVDYRLVPVREGEYPHWQGQQWADASVDHAAALMRKVFDDRELARRIGAAGAASMRRDHSKAACGAAVTARLQEIDRQRSTVRSR